MYMPALRAQGLGKGSIFWQHPKRVAATAFEVAGVSVRSCVCGACRFPGNSHLEITANEVPAAQAAAIAANMSAAARVWWSSILREPHSFTKPTFYLGMYNWTVTNMIAAGAHDRTPDRVRLLQMGAAGFEKPGDYMCFAAKVRMCWGV